VTGLDNEPVNVFVFGEPVTAKRVAHPLLNPAAFRPAVLISINHPKPIRSVVVSQIVSCERHHQTFRVAAGSLVRFQPSNRIGRQIDEAQAPFLGDCGGQSDNLVGHVDVRPLEPMQFAVWPDAAKEAENTVGEQCQIVLQAILQESLNDLRLENLRISFHNLFEVELVYGHCRGSRSAHTSFREMPVGPDAKRNTSEQGHSASYLFQTGSNSNCREQFIMSNRTNTSGEGPTEEKRADAGTSARENKNQNTNERNASGNGDGVNGGFDIPHEEDIQPFPVECLPQSLRDLVKAISESTGLPIVLSSMAGLAALSSGVSKMLRVNSGGNRTTSGNIFLLPFAESGVGKTEATRLILLPLYELHEEIVANWRKYRLGPAKAKLAMTE
jgi:uncharacterized protein DUF3987